MDELAIWLSELPLLEGCYTEFQVGDEVRFALELHVRSARPAGGGPASLEGAAPGEYQFCGTPAYRQRWPEAGRNRQGERVERRQACTVFDVGLLSYCVEGWSGPQLSDVELGSWWSGEASLCVAWHYFERYSGLPGIPGLAYRWAVRRILLDESPWVTLPSSDGQPVKVRDRTNPVFTEVSKTVTRGYRQRCYLLYCSQTGAASRGRADAPI